MEKVRAVWAWLVAAFAYVKTLVLGTKEAPTLISRTLGKAAEWVVISLVVVLFLSLLHAYDASTAKKQVSLSSAAEAVVCSAPVAKLPAPTSKPTKKASK